MENLTRTGIDIIGDVPWGTHFCQFYRTREDLLDILVPYFIAGLENNEFCMWITSEPLSRKDVLKAMRKALPNFDQYLKRGQIEILPYTKWYLKGGEFNSQRVLDGWVDKLNQALARGYRGLRLTGNTFWLEKKDWRRFTDYENEVNSVIGKYQMVAVCTYSLDKCKANEVIDVVRNHQFALIRREGEWELIESIERRRAEEALRSALEESKRRQEEISALLESCRAVLEYHEFKDTARFIFDSCKSLIGATAGYIALLSKDGKENEVLFLDSGGLPCTVDTSLSMPIRGLREEAYRSGKTVFNNEFTRSEYMRFMPEGHVNLDNVIFAPLAIKGKVIGLLGMANKPGGFTENDARLASAFGELAAVALYNSRTLEALEHSEQRLRSVVETASDAIICIDSGGHIIFWNQGAECILGYSADEARGRPITFIMPERFREAHQKALNRLISTDKSKIIGRTVEIFGLRKDGCEFPLELSLATWNIRGEIFFTGIIRDITERKKMEEELRRSHAGLEQKVRERTSELRKASELLERVFSSIGLLVAYMDRDFNFIRVNRAYAEADERTPKFYVGKNHFVLFPNEENEAIFRKVVETGEPYFTFEKPFGYAEHPERGVTYWDWSLQPVKEADGKVEGLVLSLINVTERKRMEDALRESEAQYRIVADNTYDWEFWLNPQDKFVYISPSCKRITGYNPDEFLADPDLLYRIVHSDDRPRFDAHRQEAKQKKIPGEIEFRIIRPDGTYRWIGHACQPVFDDDGRFLGTRGSNRDITERKRADEALWESENRLRHLSSELLKAQEKERKRISQELHDSIGQALAATKFTLERKLRQMNKGTVPPGILLEDVISMIQGTMEESRRISMDLWPSILDDLGILPAISWFCRNFETIYPGISIEKKIDVEEKEVPASLKIVIYRILQEALNNIVKHSKADRAHLVFRKNEDAIELLIKDNGLGFDPQTCGKGLGLSSMRERVELSGGSFLIESFMGAGTTIKAIWAIQIDKYITG